MRWGNWPAIRSLSDDWRIMQAYARKSLFVGPQRFTAPHDRSSIWWHATRLTALGTLRSATAENFSRQTSTTGKPANGRFSLAATSTAMLEWRTFFGATYRWFLVARLGGWQFDRVSTLRIGIAGPEN